MLHSVGPGKAPRSCRFQSSRISRSHGVPINSKAKYSIRCDAAPNSTLNKKSFLYICIFIRSLAQLFFTDTR